MQVPFCLSGTSRRKKGCGAVGRDSFLWKPEHISSHERGKDSWEKNHRKGRIAGALASSMCGSALILAGTSAAAETDGIHQKQTQEKKQGEKNKEKIILKIEIDFRLIPAATAGKVWAFEK